MADSGTVQTGVHDKAEGDGTSKFHVDMGLIPAARLEDDDDLKALNIGVFNQEDLEQGKVTG